MKTICIVKSILLLFVVFFFITCEEDSKKEKINTFTDPRDGKVYQYDTIGSQIWMTENLDYYTDYSSWYYNNDSVTNSVQYGRLYNWNTAQTAVPQGWHLPTKAEFETLINYLGGSGSIAYPRMIPGGESGFDALCGGFRNWDDTYSAEATAGYFWSSTMGDC